jgi:UPF0755 protein
MEKEKKKNFAKQGFAAAFQSIRQATGMFLNRRKWRLVVAGFVVFLVFFVVALAYYATAPIDRRNLTVVVDIPTGTSFIKTTEILHQAGLIKSRLLFYSLTVVKNARRQIRAGEYEINTLLSPSQMIDKLIRGEIKYHKVIIPEDLTLWEIADRLNESKMINKEVFFELARDKEFLESLHIHADSIEGYLFPDTYYLDRSMSTRRIMEKMVDNFWKKITPEMLKKLQQMNWDIHRMVIVASLIGKESGCDAEKPFISAVFHNRLKRGMPLQSDPTSVYDLGNFKGKIVRSHLKRKSPYNTYVIKGLPPGPIANPGISSIRAALYPADVKYLYFVSKKDGTHFFSNTFSEHVRAVNKYIYIKNQEDKKDSSAANVMEQPPVKSK